MLAVGSRSIHAAAFLFMPSATLAVAGEPDTAELTTWVVPIGTDHGDAQAWHDHDLSALATLFSSLDPASPGMVVFRTSRSRQAASDTVARAISTVQPWEELFHRQGVETLVALAVLANGETFGWLAALYPQDKGQVERDRIMLGMLGQLLGTALTEQRRARQAERARIERDLHDSVKVRLLSAQLLLRGLQPDEWDRAMVPPIVQRRLEDAAIARQTLRDITADIDLIVAARTGEQGDARTLGRLLEREVWVLTRGQETPRIALQVAPDLTTLAPAARDDLIAVIREALHNALVHGMAGTIDVVVRPTQHDALEIVITDDGVGFEPATLSQGGGRGLQHMQSRVQAWGGTLEIVGSRGEGTVVRASFPRRREGTA